MARKCCVVSMAASVFCLLVIFGRPVYTQETTPAASPTPTPSTTACAPIPTPDQNHFCNNGVAPGVIQLTPDASNPDNRLKLAHRRFYLSSCPFNLANNVDLRGAPSLRSYYTSAGASPQLVQWLEENRCETIYCRALTLNEVKCEGIDPNKCVPEFVSAYRNALEDLKGNQERARQWVTNYPPLSSSKLRTGFYDAKTAWLKGAVEAIEKGVQGNKIRAAISDKDGIAFFYNLCPGTYYISSIAPVEFEGAGIVWETPKPVKVEGPPSVNKAVVVTLAFPPAKDKKNFFVGKPVAEFVNNQKTSGQ